MTSSLFQSKPIRGDDELTFFPYLRPDLLLVSDTAREAACALHMGACVIHTEAGSLGAVDRNIFAVLVLWHLLSIRTTINYSHPQQCVPVVMVCSHRVFGEPHSHHFSVRICFSWNMGMFLWIFAGQEREASFMDWIPTLQLIYIEPSSEGTLG